MVVAMLMGTAFAQVELNEVSVAQEYPEGIALGDTVVRQFAIEELVDFRALDSYNQPDWMDVLVENGTLPPVEERLPDVPYVYLEGGMSNGIGEYGGVWRGFSAVPTEGWNLCSNLTQGWFGINAIYGEQLV
ncbi:MAG: ABC transporter substrate-binding protein, partial [Deinococcota bacterium]